MYTLVLSRRWYPYVHVAHYSLGQLPHLISPRRYKLDRRDHPAPRGLSPAYQLRSIRLVGVVLGQMTRRYDEVFRQAFLTLSLLRLKGSLEKKWLGQECAAPSNPAVVASCTDRASRRLDFHDEMSTCCGLLPRSLLSESIFVHRGQVIDATAQLIFFSPPPRLRCAVMTTSASFDSQRCRPSHMAIVMYFQHDRAQERPREPQNQPGHDLAPAHHLPPYLGCRLRTCVSFTLVLSVHTKPILPRAR